MVWEKKCLMCGRKESWTMQEDNAGQWETENLGEKGTKDGLKLLEMQD